MRLFSKFLMFSATAGMLSAAEPALYMPLDGSADVFAPGGVKAASGIVHGRSGYLPGVIGDGLDVKRHAYDQVTAVEFAELPPLDYNAGTFSFWLKPHWKENDPGTHWIVCLNAGNDFRFYFLKTENYGMELSVCAPGQVQILRKDMLKQEEWNHIAFTWEVKSGTVRLYVNGKPSGNAVLPDRFQQQLQAQKASIWLGDRSGDRFKANVGDGVYDEIKLFTEVLSPGEIALLASGGSETKLETRPLSEIRHTPEATEWVFRHSEGAFSSPVNLMKLSGGRREITLAAMGSSEKIALFVKEGDLTRSIESGYLLKLDEPHKIRLAYSDSTLVFLVDDAVQGKMKLDAPPEPVERVEAVAGLTLLPAQAFPEPGAAAKLAPGQSSPLEKELWSLADAVRRTEGSRSGVCLNGYWRVRPVSNYSYAPPDSGWGYMLVPGSFRSPLYDIWKEDGGKLVPCDWKWNGQELIKYRSAWYQRTFRVPEQFREGRVYLNFTNLNADNGRVCLNGRMIDDFRQEFKNFPTVPNTRRLDVTDLLVKDADQTLTLFIDRDYVDLWRGSPSIADHSEIAIGDVWLENAPSPVALTAALALPSVRKQEITLRARLQNPAGIRGSGEVNFTFHRKETGRNFKRTFQLSGEPEQLVTFTSPWENPELWDADNPRLYDMTVSLAVDGKNADSLAPLPFGFREAWVEGGDIRLNGRKTRLRMWANPSFNRLRYYYGHPEAAGQYVAYIREMNYDTVRFDPIGKTSQVGWQSHLAESDRQGLYNLFPMPPYEEEEPAGYAREVERYLEHYGNHPSILMWYTDFNTCSYPWNQDPAKLNDTEYEPQSKRQARRLARTAESVMRSFDSSRELFQHAGGNSGKIFGSMNYQSFGTPLQEQEDWPKQWSQNHTTPLMVVESAFPYPLQFWHFDDPEVGSLAAEHAARYFGDAVFAREAIPAPNASIWQVSPYAHMGRNMQDLFAILYRHVVKAWRAYDVSILGDFTGGRDMYHTARTYDQHTVVYDKSGGKNVKTPGLKPERIEGWSETQRHLLTDYSQPGYLHDTVRASFSPLLVFLGGDTANFTNKDHAFYAGETFRKSAVVVNDRTTPVTLQVQWKLLVGDAMAASGTLETTVASGGIAKLPIELAAPQVYKRTDAELRLIALRDGTLIGEDYFELQFFPKRSLPEYRDISAGLYDPAGKTGELLKKAGFPFREVNSLAEVRQCRLLIIGQNALGQSHPEFLKQLEEAGLIEGGLKILIFEQQPCNLGNLVFESPSYRNAFLRRPDSPYTTGLKEEDFSNWRGSSDTVPEFVLSAENSPHYPRSRWKCGNGGIVSGNVIRKPGYGNFTTIVDSGFNLMFASLMELRKGHGLVLFCQLDVTSRYGTDPVATRLVDNMLTEMGKRFVPVGPQRVGYLGSGEGERILKRMGMTYRKADADRMWELDLFQVLILGPDAVPVEKRDAFLRQIAEGGQTLIALPGAQLELLPGKLERGTRIAFRASAPKEDPVFAGIPDADLYFREAKKLPALVSAPDWIVGTTPLYFAKLDQAVSAAVVLNFGPDDIDGVWNREKISRVWSTIFTNMNIGLGKDLQLFTSGRMRHNTQEIRFGEAVPEHCGLRFDPRNDGKADDPSGFQPIKLGLSWESQGFQEANPGYVYPADTPKELVKPYDGYAWYRCTVNIPANWKGCRLRLTGGPVDDCDWSYWNGVKIGETTFDSDPDCYRAIRNYPIPEELVKFGEPNTLVIRVFDRWGEGGVTGPLKVIAEKEQAPHAWSPYIDQLDFYDADAFHNW